MNNLKRVGVGTKRKLRNQVEFHQSHLKTVGENVGKWEGGSARMYHNGKNTQGHNKYYLSFFRTLQCMLLRSGMRWKKFSYKKRTKK